VELVLVVFGLLAVATPPLTVFLLWRQHKLRQQLLELTESSNDRNDALHRELLELKRQVAASPRAADSAPPSYEETVRRTPVAMPPIAEKPVAPPGRAEEPAAKPVPVEASPIEESPFVDKRSQSAFCAWCGKVHAGGVSNCPTPEAAGPPSEVQRFIGWAGSPEKQKEEEVPAVRESIPGAPAAPAASQPVARILGEPKPGWADLSANLPPAAAPVTPVNPPQAAGPAEPSTPPLPVIPPAPPRTETPHAPPAPRVVLPHEAARVAAPPQFAPLRSSAPKPTAQQRLKSVFALEEKLGTNWLNKLGIIILVLGVALFGIYELGQLGPLGKVGLSYVVSLALLGGGIFLERRERYRVLGHTLIGGGWALLFFTTYALQHVQAMRVMGSETTDLIFMLAVAIAMAVHTLRYRSQLVTGLAFLLAYSTVALSHDDVYSLSSGVILAIGLVSIVIKMDWFELEVFGILSSYLNHLYWLYRLLGPEGAQAHAFPEYHASTAILLFYWLIFRTSYVVRKIKSPFLEHISTAAALINTLLLLGVMKFQSVRPELAALALLLIGAAEFSLGQLPMIKRRREAFIVLSVLGAALMIAAVPFHYSGNNVAILWLIGAEAFLAAGVVVGEVVFRRLGLLTGFLVGAHLVRIDFMQLISVRQTSEALVLTVGVMFGLCAIVFYLNALFIGERWARAFGEWPDAQLLCAHSYLGGFAAASAAWALCSHDWTAVAFAAIMLALSGLGSKLKSWHLQLQYGAMGVLTLYRVVVVNAHTELPQYTHVRMRLLTLPVIAAAFYVTAKWAAYRDDQNQRTLRGVFAIAGTALVTLLGYYEVPELWQPLAAIAFAVSLLEVGRWIEYHALAWHAHVLTALAVVAAVTADASSLQRWHTIPLHALGALPVVAGAYWIAKRISLPNQIHIDPRHLDFERIAYCWVGTGVMVWMLNEAVPAPWIAVAWVLFAVALALALRWIGYKHLAWQANAVAACALVRACTYNLTLEQMLWRGISVRLATVSIVAAGLYFLSRQATVPDSESRRAITYLHTFAATALLAVLAWYEAPGGWLAVVWAVFALALAIVDRRFELEELAWQAHALAGLAMFRSVTVNLYVTQTWHGISVRLLSLSTVAVVLYVLSRIIRMPEEWRTREFHHIYSWAASALVSLLMWYELQPLSVAVGWAVFGLVLFEYGLWRNTRQFRFQAYVALAAAFGRIFFANLTSGNLGEFWGPRVYTVLPLTLIFFFVYAQLGQGETTVRDDRRLYFDVLMGYMGTGSVVALLYFQFANDWLATAWAVVVFVLLGLALLLGRPIFLHQGLLLTLGACTRGVMHNLFGASYFSGGDWTGRYLVLGSAVAILLACLSFAFRLRDRYQAQPSSNRWIGVVVRHPEQFMFFAPVLLLTLMLALKMRAGMVTVAWGIEGVLIVLLALAVSERSYRLAGLSLLLLCVGKVLARDAWGLAPRDRYITFIILGAALLLVSFLYSKYRDAIRQFL
jgi:Predicted membrane protein (DUF2339)